MMNRRAVVNDIMIVLLLTILLLCSANVTPRQRIDSNRNDRALAVVPASVSAAQVSSNGLIAFSADNQIYVMNDDGSDLRRLTDGAPRVINQYPAFSPDGTSLAFIRDDENSYEHALYVIGIDGRGLRPLVNGFTHLGEPTWSPDGTRIAFVRGHDTTFGGYAYKFSCRSEIYVVNVASHKQVNLTQGDGGTDPTWSPDGTRIAFSSYRDNNYEIYTMDSDGKDVKRLTYTEGAEAEPAWSPDGKQIAYAADLIQLNVDCGFIPTGRSGNPMEGWTCIYVMTVDGSDQTRLGVTSGGNEPAWSPDGAGLALVITNAKGDSQIYVTDADGTRLTALTSDSTQKSSPSWSNPSR